MSVGLLDIITWVFLRHLQIYLFISSLEASAENRVWVGSLSMADDQDRLGPSSPVPIGPGLSGWGGWG